MAIVGSGGTFVFAMAENVYGTYANPTAEVAAEVVSNAQVGEYVVIASLGNTSSTEWNTIAGTTNVTYGVGDGFVVQNTITADSGEGTVTIEGFKFAIRPGSIPSKSQQRIHARTLGGIRDVSPSYVSKSSVAGGYSFYIPTNVNLGNNLHAMAGVHNSSLVDIPSYSIHHPFLTTSVDTNFDKGFKYTGMMATQYTLSLPNADSLLESSISFIGKDQEINLDDEDFDSNNIHKAGQETYYESWNSFISLDPSNTYDGWDTEQPIELYNFTVTVNNNLIAPSFIDSNLTAINSKPNLTGRSVTGSFTMCYQDSVNTTDTASSLKLLNQIFSDNLITWNMKIRCYSSKQTSLNANKTSELLISMPRVILEQSGTPNSISNGLFQIPFSFRAIGDSANPLGTSTANSEIIISQSMV